MKTSLYLVLFLSIISLLGKSQSQNLNIDSLERILSSTSGSKHIRIINQLSDIYRKTDKEKSLQFAIKAYKLSKGTDYKNEIYSIANLMDGYALNRNYDSSDYYVEKGLELSNQQKDTFYMMLFLTNIGNIKSYEGKFNEAKAFFKKSLELYKSYEHVNENERIIHPMNYARLLNNIANIYARQNYNDSAMMYLKESLEYRQKMNAEPKLIAPVILNIGAIYYKSNQYEDAITYFKKANEIYHKTNDSSKIASCYINLAASYRKINDTTIALELYKKALNLNLKLNNEKGIINTYLNMGVLELHSNNYEKAEKYINESLKRNNTRKFTNLYSDAVINLATLYNKLKNYSKAIPMAEESIKIYELNGNRIGLQNTYLMLADAYEGLNNYEKSLENYKIYKLYQDSILNETSQEHLNLVQAQFETVQNEKHIIELKAESEIQKSRERLLKIGVFSIIIVFLFIILIIALKRRKDKQIIYQKELVLLKENELSKIELEKSKIKEQELNTQLEYKSKQLTSHALNMMKKNQFLQELEGDVAEISKNSDDEVKNKLRNLKRSIGRMNKSDKDWELFKNYFEEVNTGFYQRLGERFEKLSSNDYKLLALIKLNMNIKETASVLNISPDSVKTARYRLRKKLLMKQEDDLYEFVSRI